MIARGSSTKSPDCSLRRCNITAKVFFEPDGGFGDGGEGKSVVRIHGEFGVDEEKNCLLNGLHSGDGSSIRAGGFDLNGRFRVHIYAEENIFVV